REPDGARTPRLVAAVVRRTASGFILSKQAAPDDSSAVRRMIIPRSTTVSAVFLALLGVVALAGANVRAADVYDAAAGHAGRSSDDLKRDSLDHPAEVLRLAGIKPGMQVADFLAGDGYYSELLSYLVGPKGHVYLLNNTAYDTWSEG